MHAGVGYLIRNLLCERQRPAAVLAGDHRRAARRDGVHEVGELALERLFGSTGTSPPSIAGAGLPLDEPPYLQLLRRVVDRDVGLRLEEADLPHALAADAARGQVRDAAVAELEACVRNVDATRQHGHADRLDGLDLRLDQRQDDVHIVDHQVEDDVDVEAPLGERTQAVDLDESRIAQQRARRGDGWIEALGLAHGEERLRSAAAAIMSSASARLRAIGFSTSTWTPAARNGSAISR